MLQSLLQRTTEYYKVNAIHINTAATVAGVVAVAVSGATTAVLLVVGLLGATGSFWFTRWLRETPLPARQSLRQPEQLRELAEQILSPSYQDDDERTRVYCEAILYALENTEIRRSPPLARTQIFYALAAAYMKLTVHFHVVRNGAAADDVLRRIKMVRQRIGRLGLQNESEVLALLQFALAYAAYRARDLQAAKTELHICLAPECSNDMIKSRALDLRGTIHQSELELHDAESRYLVSLEVKERIGDEDGTAITFGNLGRLKAHLFEFDTAIERFRKNIAISTRLSDSKGVYQSYGHIGFAQLCLERPSDAIASFRASLRAGDSASVVESARKVNAGFAAMGMYLSYRYLGEMDASAEWLRRASTAFEDSGFGIGSLVLGCYCLGLDAIESGRPSLVEGLHASLDGLSDSLAVAGIVRMLQIFALDHSVAEALLVVARRQFDQRNIPFYRAKFALIPPRRKTVVGAATLPAPLGEIFGYHATLRGSSSSRSFFLGFEVFLRWCLYVLMVPEGQNALRALPPRKTALGILLGALVRASQRRADTATGIPREIAKRVVESEERLQRIVEQRNAWAHGGSEPASQIDVAALDVVVAVVGGLTSQVGHHVLAPKNCRQYEVANVVTGDVLNMSPQILYAHEDSEDVFFLYVDSDGVCRYFSPHTGSEVPIEGDELFFGGTSA